MEQRPRSSETTVTVVVPTYQHAAFIGECLDSILAQECTHPFHVLVGEDGSTDGTREICLDFQRRFPDRVSVLLNDRNNVIHVEGSPTGRWNVLNLYRKATGSIIALCEGDDRWCDTGKLQRQVDLLLSDPTISGSFHDTAVIDQHGQRTGKLFREQVPAELRLGDLLGTLALVHPSAFVFRNYHHFDRHPAWFNTAGTFDMVLFAFVADEGRLVKAPGVMSEYRKHEGGITARAHNRGARVHVHRMAMWLRLADNTRHMPAGPLAELLHKHMRALGTEHGRTKAIAAWWELLRTTTMAMARRPRLALELLRTARRTPHLSVKAAP